MEKRCAQTRTEKAHCDSASSHIKRRRLRGQPFEPRSKLGRIQSDKKALSYTDQGGEEDDRKRRTHRTRSGVGKRQRARRRVWVVRANRHTIERPAANHSALANGG